MGGGKNLSQCQRQERALGLRADSNVKGDRGARRQREVPEKKARL